MYSYGCNISHRIHIPYLTEDLFLGIDMIGMLREEGKQVKFLRGELLLHTVDPDTAGRLVDLEPADHDLISLALGTRETLITA